MDSSDAIAAILAELRRAAAHAGDAESPLRSVRALTPEDVQKAAAKYLVENGPDHRHAHCRRSRGEAANEDCLRRSCCWPPRATAQIRVVQLPGKSPLVTFRFVFTTGAASDPAEKPGLAASDRA